MSLSDLRTPVLSALRWTAASRVLMQVVTWTATLIAVRLLSPTDYGIVAVATLLSGYLGLLSEVGFGSAIIYRQIRDPITLYTIFVSLLAVGALLALVAFMSAPLIASLFGEPRAESVARLVALQFLLTPFITIPDARLRMELRFKELGISNFAAAITSAVCVVTLALFGAGPFSLAVATLMGQLVRAAILNWLCPMKYFLSIQLAHARELLRYSGLIVVERSAWYWYSEADVAVVGRFLGAQFVGVYSIAKTVIQAPLDRISEILNVVSFPAYASIQQNRMAVIDAYMKALRVGAYVAFPLFWGIGAVAPSLMLVVFGQKWLAAVAPLQVLAIAMPLRAVQSMTTPLMHAIGRPDTSLSATIASLLVIVPSIFIGVSQFGLTGAAGGWAVGFPIVFAFSSTLFARSLDMKASRIWASIARPALCSFAMVLTVRTCTAFLGEHTATWITLLGSVITGFVSYCAFVLLLDRKSFNELFHLVTSLLGRKRPQAAVST